MFGWALLFFFLALFSGALGYFGQGGAMTDMAQLLFFVSLVLLVLLERFIAHRR